MRPILDLLNQPIVLTIITLAIGGYLISAIADHRARKDKLREKAIDFLADIGNVLNAFISSMYGPLITKDPYNEQAFKDSFTALFAKRMSVRVASEAYLNSQSFPRQYDQLLEELGQVGSFLRTLPKKRGSQAEIQRIFEHRTRFREAWPIDAEPPRPTADSPVGELMLWLDMILDRVTAMLSSHLKAVLR